MVHRQPDIEKQDEQPGDKAVDDHLQIIADGLAPPARAQLFEILIHGSVHLLLPLGRGIGDWLSAMTV